MKVKATGYHFYAAHEAEYDTVHEAMEAAYRACEQNTWYVEFIIDGDKTYNRDDMLAYWDEYGRE